MAKKAEFPDTIFVWTGTSREPVFIADRTVTDVLLRVANNFGRKMPAVIGEYRLVKKTVRKLEDKEVAPYVRGA